MRVRLGLRVSLVSLGLLVVACTSTLVESGSADSTSEPSDAPTSVTPVTEAHPTSTSSTTPSEEIEALAPITGYGDFSELDYNQVDWFLVTELMHQCIVDQGFPVRLIPPGDGLDFTPVPADQNRMASLTADACREGLNLPPERDATPDELRDRYRYWVDELIPCLEALGYTAPEPPSEDYFAENYYQDPYDPYGQVPWTEQADAITECPSRPPDWLAYPEGFGDD